MHSNPFTENTQFSRDVMGRYICNGLDEAMNSTDTSLRADARPFDIIVIGGGSFGAALAQHLFSLDTTHAHRVLILEGGPFVLPEHVQNMPMIGLAAADPTSVSELQHKSPIEQQQWGKEVWGLAWHSQTRFPGLAYCVGGRSLYWGGWSPQLLDAEMHTAPVNGAGENLWPSDLVADFHALPGGEGYFRQAGRQLGATETNDFIQGPMHESLRQMLYDGIIQNKVSNCVPLSELTLNADVPPWVPPAELDKWKLEAPLAVQSRTRSGFFPINKFSAVPLLIKAEREAQLESGNDDVKKRLMVVPNCHVKRLRTQNGQVTMVETNLGDIPLTPSTKVIIALGTIESTRLALNSFSELPNYGLIGHNLMAHLRSNLTIRIPRTALNGLAPTLKELEVSALFVKGRVKHADHTEGYFHLQITASGLGASSKPDAEAEMFRKIPDIDGFDVFQNADDKSVVMTIRGIGQMESQNPANFVRLDPNLDADEYGIPRAFVQITDPQSPAAQSNPLSAKDLTLWNAMDQTANDVAKIFAGTVNYEIIGKNRDTIGTTHHESGTLWMGDNPTKSVTTSSGQFHHLANAYAVGPAVFPTMGSPNPMLTGIAMTRRLVDRLLSPPTFTPAESGYQALFDGVNASHWKAAGPGNFIVVDGAIEAIPGNDIGLYWCDMPTPADFSLKLDWRCSSDNDNSGVFIRFPNPLNKGYGNPAYVGVHFGFEVQIDAQGRPDGLAIHKTGAIYGEPTQVITPVAAKAVGEWNEYEIRVKGQTYTVLLNGQKITQFQNQNPARGVPGTSVAPSLIGLQAHTGRVAFRRIRIKAI